MEKKITFTGDVLCSKDILQKTALPEGGWDFDSLFAGLKDAFSDSDLVVGNLETPVAGKEFGITEENFWFNAPVDFLVSMKKVGFNYVSTANNHCMDRGVKGLIATLDNLDKLGIGHCGTVRNAKEKRSDIVEVGGIRLGMLGYTYGVSGFERINLLEELKLKYRIVRAIYYSKLCKPLRWDFKALLKGKKKRRIVQIGKPHRSPMGDSKRDNRRCRLAIMKEINRLRSEGVDLLVVNCHAGGQYMPTPEAPVVEYAKWFYEQGVNAVVINHEHVVQEADFSELESSNRFIAYCLGNCVAVKGVLYPPYEYKADCSIALHMYIDEETKRISRCGFTILKIHHAKDGRLYVLPLAKMIEECQDEDEKAKLIADNLFIYNRFMKTEKESVEIKLEYSCGK